MILNSYGILTLERGLLREGRCSGRHPSPSRCLIWDLNERQKSVMCSSQAYVNVRRVQ